MGRSRYKITDPTQPHFVTLTVLHWIPVFTRPDTVNILFDSIRFLGKEGLKVYAYVVLENHCHFVLQCDALDRDIRRLKSRSAKQLIQFLTQQGIRQNLDQLAFYKKAHKDDRAYQFWQEGVHPGLIQNDEMKYVLSLEIDSKPAQDDGTHTCNSRALWKIQSIPRGKAGGECEEYWAKNRVRLEPYDRKTKDACSPRRGGFYLHDSAKGYTHGCIETEKVFYFVSKICWQGN